MFFDFRRATVVPMAAFLTFAAAASAAAQQSADDKPAATASAAAAAPAQESSEPDDRSIDPAQPDFTVINLPTTLRLPRWKGSFRVSHRFTRSVSDGSFGDLLADGLGTDFGSVIGLEFRFGLPYGAQVGVFRTSEKTVEFFTQKEVIRQSERVPLSVAAFGSLEGGGNFDSPRAGGLGLVASRTFGERGAVYAQPLYVRNTNPSLVPSEDHDQYGNHIAYRDTTMLGLGARFSVIRSLYLTGEYAPRIRGFRGPALKAFGVEKLVGGHMFQINVSNALGLSLADVARGTLSDDHWYIGFNLSRKFY
jgi:Membrane bound beta barrel domain (DUF5777)